MTTAISWASETWNPIRARRRDGGKLGWHCVPVSEACRFCYAGTLNLRRGTGLAYKPGHQAELEIFLDENTLEQPLHCRKPRIVFVCSMSDLFGEWVEERMIREVYRVMRQARRHTFMVLTKRPGRLRDYFRDPLAHPHVWHGVSVEDQASAARIHDLRWTPSAHRFVSYEPALGAVDFMAIEVVIGPGAGASFNALTGDVFVPGAGSLSAVTYAGPPIDLLIAGGESGPGHRMPEMRWFETAQMQCAAVGVPFHFKQDGGLYPGRRGRASDRLWAAKAMPGDHA